MPQRILQHTHLQHSLQVQGCMGDVNLDVGGIWPSNSQFALLAFSSPSLTPMFSLAGSTTTMPSMQILYSPRLPSLTSHWWHPHWLRQREDLE
jgi:hypothetical protein